VSEGICTFLGGSDISQKWRAYSTEVDVVGGDSTAQSIDRVMGESRGEVGPWADGWSSWNLDNELGSH
jgi:hypothetical protein